MIGVRVWEGMGVLEGVKTEMRSSSRIYWGSSSPATCIMKLMDNEINRFCHW